VADDAPALSRTLTCAVTRRYLGGPLSEQEAAEAVRGPFGRVPGSFVAATPDASTGRDDAIGTIGLDRRGAARPGHISSAAGELELSFVVLPEYRSQGLAFEAVSTVLTWAWTNLPDDVVVAVTQTANESARRLLARLGFDERDQFSEFGADQTLYALSRP
jgi:RimJ/RimL family protein N-acetyltransferase